MSALSAGPRLPKWSAGGPGKGRVLQQSDPTRFPGRGVWIVPECRPRDLFVDDADLFVDKRLPPSRTAVTGFSERGFLSTCAHSNLFHMSSAHHEPSAPSGVDSRVGASSSSQTNHGR